MKQPPEVLWLPKLAIIVTEEDSETVIVLPVNESFERSEYERCVTLEILSENVDYDPNEMHVLGVVANTLPIMLPFGVPLVASGANDFIRTDGKLDSISQPAVDPLDFFSDDNWARDRNNVALLFKSNLPPQSKAELLEDHFDCEPRTTYYTDLRSKMSPADFDTLYKGNFVGDPNDDNPSTTDRL